MTTIVLGSQWGDEGKGKLTDILLGANEADICARAAGGHNAGHSVVANGVSYSFHLLPSGLINPKCRNFIGSSVVFHVPSFFSELEKLEEKGLVGVRDRIFVSDRCQVNFDLHAAVDGLEEIELGERKIGTTGRGIGPSYSTKATRSGVRISDIFKEDLFEKKLRQLADGYKKRFGDLLKYDVEEEIERFKVYRAKLADFVVDGVEFMNAAQEKNLKILVEGANALMLDIDYGTYPFVSSSNPCLGGCITGLALNPFKIKEIIGVVKAYTTRVGGGIFKTEDLGEVGDKLQEIGREWGYSNSINHYTALNLTKLDVLDTFPTIKVAVAYRDKETGATIDYFPADLDFLTELDVVYEEFEGWNKPTTGAKSFYDLPKQARAYVEFIEKFVGVKIKWIGTGPARENMIVK